MCLHHITVYLFWCINKKIVEGISYIFMIGYNFFVIVDILYFLESAFNGNCIEYESNGDKDKNLSVKKYLSMIRPYLSDVINDYKAFKNLKAHSGNEVSDY